MPVIAQLILLTCITGIGSGALGAGIATMFDSSSNRMTSILLSFAAGLMLSIVCFDFIPEALELEEGLPHLFLVVAFISAGAALVGILVHVIDKKAEKHNHCCVLDDPEIAAALDEETRNAHLQMHDRLSASQTQAQDGKGGSESADMSPEGLKVAGTVLAAAIAMHNLPAGMSIGASFADASGALVASGVTVAIVMGLHSIPESMSLGVPFMHAGYSRGKTIGIGALVGSTMVIGAVIGYAVGGIGMFWLAMSLAFASGAMLYVLFGEILPEAFSLFHSKKPTVAVIVGLVCGLVLVNL